MEVSIKNLTAHALADAARSKKNITPMALDAIYVRPDGLIAGTNGYVLAWHPDGVEPYDGEAMAIVPPKFPKNARGIVYNVDDMTVTYMSGHKHERAVFTVSKGAYPDFERVTPTKTEPFPADTIGLNPRYLTTFYDVLPAAGGTAAGVRITYTGEGSPLIVGTTDPEQRLLVMPLVNSTKAAEIPWLARG